MTALSPETVAVCRKAHCATERHVTAAKNYLCDWCGGSIPKGAEHVIATEFPGGEAGYADSAGRPVRWRIHIEVPCHYCPGRDVVTSPGQADR